MTFTGPWILSQPVNLVFFIIVKTSFVGTGKPGQII